MKPNLQNVFLGRGKIVFALMLLMGFVLLNIPSSAQTKSHADIRKELIAKSKAWQSSTAKKDTVYPYHSIYEIQYCAPESLAQAEALQLTDQASHWTLQASKFCKDADKVGYDATGLFYYNTDTISIVGVVIANPKVITYTANGYNIILADTGYYSTPQNVYNNGPFRNIFVRCPVSTGSADTVKYQWILGLEKGDVVRITGWVWEFPSYGESGAPAITSQTEFVPLSNAAPFPVFELLDSGYPLPKPRIVSSPNPIYQGLYPGGKILMSSGEELESSIIEAHGFIVPEYIYYGDGTFNMVDDYGNAFPEYDCSKWFTLRAHKDPSSTFANLPLGSRIDTIRGMMMPSSGAQAPRGYRIAPIDPGDIVLGTPNPIITQHRRYPVVVAPDSAPKIQVRSYKLAAGYDIFRDTLYYSVNYGPWQKLLMLGSQADSLYYRNIPKQAAGTNVRYFIKVYDTFGKSSTLANAALNAFSSDTSKGFFWYTVLNRELTIHDIQYQPYPHGRSPYNGAYPFSVTGTVTVDTSDMPLTPYSTTGTNCWYIQSGNAPWSGLWIVGPESTLAGVHKGDSIRVTGAISEYNDVTRMDSIQYPIQIIATGRPIPAPVSLPTSSFTVGVIVNGDTLAERWESMLVQFDSVKVNNVWPYFSDPTMYSVTDGSDVTTINRDGKNNFSNLPADTLIGKDILSVGDRIAPLKGIVFYNFDRYKVDPRTNADISAGSYYTYNSGWNLISVPFVPRDTLSLTKVSLYPTASSNAFAYAGGYNKKDTLTPGVGYWLKFPTLTTQKMFGRRLTSKVVPVNAGWNLLGSITGPISTIAVIPNSGNAILSSFYKYQNGYLTSTSIDSGKGYWIKVRDAGTLTLGGVSLFLNKEADQYAKVEDYNTITITDKNGSSQTLYFGLDADGKVNKELYEMPPLPPSSIFDVRFASQRILETYPRDIAKYNQHTININSAEFPVTISWNVNNSNGKNFSITDAVNGKLIGVRDINGEGSIKVSNRNLNSLTLKIQNGEELPIEFGLGQNYPNPFNPTTKMEIAVPKAAMVEIVVYNILGQKVRTLTNEVVPAGYHTIEWNGKSDAGSIVPSGVYFMRMVSGSFTKVNKLLMMK
jgi:hypothetical protein